MSYRNTFKAILLLVALVALAVLSVYLVQPPAPVQASAAPEVFSAERAMQHVRQIARAPHAMGTAEHAKVRNYLLVEMEKLGLNPEVQETTSILSRKGAMSVGYVYNLVGRLKGEKSSDKALLLVAHYDSQPNALGAGDDASGVAAILETIRAIRQMPTPANDIIVLFTDGEEYGLYGARAFLKHTWAKEVEMVLNVEGRGTRGPSMTFELSPENGWVAKQYIEHAPYPFVSSLAYEIYKRMPNDTDFTVFKNEGYSGLNSAFIDGFVHYHKATDSPENLDLGTLQQHGANMLALVKHLANTSLANTKAPDLIFFNFINGWVISYAQWLNILWVVITTTLLALTLRLGLKKGLLHIRQAVGGFLIFLAALVVTVGLFWQLNNLVLDMLPFTHRGNGVYSSDEFFLGYILIALGIFMLLSWLTLRWMQVYSYFMGIMAVQFVLMMLLVFTIPNAAYLLMFPLLFSLAGLLLVLMKGENPDKKALSVFATLTFLVASVPAIFILMPILQIVFVAFSLQLPFGTLALFILLLGLLMPLLYLIERSLSWKRIPVLPILMLGASSLQLYLAIEHEKPSAKQPLHSYVTYLLNADTDQAYWVSPYLTTDDWNQQFFANAVAEPLIEMYPMAYVNFLKSPAEPLQMPAPQAEVLLDSITNRFRVLKLRLTSPRKAAHLEVIVKPERPEDLQYLNIAGEDLQLSPIDTKEGHVFYTRIHGLPLNKEIEMEVHLTHSTPLTLYLYDQVIGLPQELVKNRRPAHVVADQGGISNLSIVRKTYQF